ncbi:MAG: methylated-DNA--[protein]-cysteine S-methyltransferase [Phascolarctobacterium sp.]|uniref:methylated-DNA--[protein]-cysteine S-methyltransferase n=1 Tax=Phascolarctobacterium sp. TaxID=2049039 RepID=UPI0026DAFC52|nr:methylated-DNA--[protein]-cysteine S-methyltransferase [Phascolarctobacterium sp.]MDO4921844.1 methylated-DNA--[protein]-cysteine S-methyltransferase [Phascolarctobacterium sp.]
MFFKNRYASPLGEMIMLSDGESLTNLNFIDDKFYPAALAAQSQEAHLPVFDAAAKWLDVYFAGNNPGALPPLSLQGSAFSLQVWRLLAQIPYGGVVTYKELAQKIAAQRGLTAMSAQAVGGAVGHNPVCIMVPCHRVVGTNGSLTGYAGGLWRKERLLQLEGFAVQNLFAVSR